MVLLARLPGAGLTLCSRLGCGRPVRFSAAAIMKVPSKSSFWRRVAYRAAALAALACAAAAPRSYADRLRPVHAKQAMVVSLHPEASRVGAEIMRQGGNAAAAAVATGFALAVVPPAPAAPRPRRAPAVLF